jgi:hypothetical protein
MQFSVFAFDQIEVQICTNIFMLKIQKFVCMLVTPTYHIGNKNITKRVKYVSLVHKLGK